MIGTISLIDGNSQTSGASKGICPSFSIVICTYNRSDKLRLSLESIAAAVSPKAGPVELLVIDNNSTDGTEDVVRQFASLSHFPVRYVLETLQGLCFARNRGVAEAKGEIIAFTDDDCLVDGDWVTTIRDEFAKNCDIWLIGGRVDLHSPQDKPISIRPLDRRVTYQGPEQLFSLIMGCNFAFRRALADLVGIFDPVFGGTSGVNADDVEFIYRVVRKGLRVEFVPEMKVRHDHGRRTDVEVKNVRDGCARGRGAFYCKYGLQGDIRILRGAYWDISGELGGIARALYERKPVRPSLQFLKQLMTGALIYLVRACHPKRNTINGS